MDNMNVLFEIPQCWKNQLAWPLRLTPGIDVWPALEMHGLGGIAGHGIVQGLFQTGAMDHGARSRYYTNLLRHEKSVRLCVALTEAARTEGIGLSVLKGPALTTQAYGDGGLRGYGDVDLFVRTRNDALRLLARLGCHTIVEKDIHGLSSRIREPGKVGAEYGGVTLEVMYPVAAPADPMQALLCRHADSILRVPDGLPGLLDPDPNLHFMFLVMHMAINHMCSRLIWYWDLVMFAEAQSKRLDADWLARELQVFQILGVASAVGAVCKRHWNAVLPLPAPKKGWNQPFLSYATRPSVILDRKLDLWSASRLRKLLLRTLYAAGLYLMCDPQARGAPYAADDYAAARLRHALGIGRSPLKRLTSYVARWMTQGFARLFCRVLRLHGAANLDEKDRNYAIAAKKA